MRFRIRFGAGCLVTPTGTDAFDVNKGVGLGVGNHRWESMRLGWRSNGSRIELSAYYYVDGVRHSDNVGELVLGSYAPDQWIEGTIAIRKGSLCVVAGGRIVRVQRGKPNWLPVVYLCHPFYGGDQPAPAECVVDVEVLSFES